MDDSIKVVVRVATVQDKDFIMATWLNNNRYGSPYFELQDPGLYYREHADKVTKAICQPTTKAVIACDESNPAWIVGFAVFSGPEIHYVYVRKGYRGKGISKLMLGNQEFSKVRSLTKIGAALSKKRGYVFEPL